MKQKRRQMQLLVCEMGRDGDGDSAKDDLAFLKQFAKQYNR
jgi:hypothetical protein